MRTATGLPRQALLVILGITLFRMVVAARTPLNGDEAYYWLWSRHLAFGYLDHPPMIAWLIAATAWLGHNSFAVRVPFIVCYALAALFVGRTAIVLSGNPVAGTAAVVLIALIPQPRSLFGEALPDSPYMFFWAAGVFLVARAARRPTLLDFILLGLAFGGAILSRFFGWALIFGVIANCLAPEGRVLWKRGLWLSLLIAVAMYVPLIMWNAAHGWINFLFGVTGRDRLHQLSVVDLSRISTLRTIVFAIAMCLAAWWAVIRPKYTLLVWTALPLPLFLVLSSLIFPIESNYVLGPFTSLAVGVGIAYTRMPRVWRRVSSAAWLTAAIYTMLLVVFPCLPEPAQAAVIRGTRGSLNGLFSPGIFKYRMLAQDVPSQVRGGSVLVVSDAYETAAQLQYFGVDAFVTGTTLQSVQWHSWETPDPTKTDALIITGVPLVDIEPLVPVVACACKSARPGPVWRYNFAGVDIGAFYTTWCTLRSPDAHKILIGY